MKTNKMFGRWIADKEGVYVPEWISGASAGWNAALVSVVEEPVLTEEEMTRKITAWWPGDLMALDVTTHIKDLVRSLSAGSIPASKPVPFSERRVEYALIPDDPTPQQEGGLTRDTGSSALYTANLRIDQLEQELAEAKKGRYAIPPVDEWRPGVEELVICAYDQNGIYQYTLGNFPRPEAPTPTVEQMTKEILSTRYARTSVTSVEDVCAELIQEIANGSTVESLWRRDCKGGVKCFHRFENWSSPFNSKVKREFGRFGETREVEVVQQCRKCNKCGLIESREIRDGLVQDAKEQKQ
jgi:hypothetical protein